MTDSLREVLKQPAESPPTTDTECHNSHLHLASELLLTCQLPHLCLPNLHRLPPHGFVVGGGQGQTSCLLLSSETSWMSSSPIPPMTWLPVAGVSGR